MEIEVLLASYVRILGQAAIVVYAYSWAIRTVDRGTRRGIAVGLLFGIGGMLSMNDPIHLMPGIIYDSRTILVALAPIYGGPIGTVIAVSMMGIYRLIIGGIGATGGAVSILIVALVGYALTFSPRSWLESSWRRGALFGLATISSFIILVFLPGAVARELFVSAAAPVMAANVAGVLLMSDLLEREKYRLRMQRALENEASVDPLTKLPNRRVLQRAGDQCTKAASTFSVIMLDIDHFKKINDTWGHLVGDTVLANVADVVRRMIRETDIAVRYGGEEIVILLPDTRPKSAAIVAEKIRKEVEAAVSSAERASIQVTVSIGIASASPAGQEFQAILAEADKALYRAKTAGRNRVELSLIA